MDIILHYPKDGEAAKILMKKAASAHAEAVLQYVDKLDCPKEQKIALIDSLIEKGPR